jgi:hypothetical protein
MAKWSVQFAFVALIAATAGNAQTMGEVRNGVYRHNRTGIEFAVPSDWVIVSEGRASSGAQTVMVRDTVSNVVATVWLKARIANPADIPALMSRPSRHEDRAAQQLRGLQVPDR